MTFVEQLIQDIGDITKYKAVDKDKLKALGYDISKNYIKVWTEKKNKTPNFIIHEVLDEDTNKPASFCYLYSIPKKSGLVIILPFQTYLDRMGNKKTGE